MPHDHDGHLVSVGDIIHIPCVVKSITSDEGYCNLTVETKYTMPPENKYTDTYTLNASQVYLTHSDE